MRWMTSRRNGRRGDSALRGVVTTAAVLTAIALHAASADDSASPPHDGAAIYQRLCAACHGASGEGVRRKHSRPLAGDKTIPDLARYIEKSMPDKEPERCAGEEAEAVARYIHGAFYSPIAQARLRPPRAEASRLTVRQYRNALADLIGWFRPDARVGTDPGLAGEYFDSHRVGDQRVLERVDPRVVFDFRAAGAVPDELAKQGFAARWRGAVLAPETGLYDFAVHTEEAVRLWVNDDENPLIDAWVKSGDDTGFTASLFLIGGRAYPLRLEFTSRTQGVQDQVKKRGKDGEQLASRLELRWTVPGHVEAPIPPRHLRPESPSEVFVVTTPFPPDDQSEGYERGSAVSKAWDDATTAAAIEAAAYVREHLDLLAGVGRGDSQRTEKIHAFCRDFVGRAFRRPLDQASRETYVERRFAGAPDLETAAARVVLLALKSPRFLDIAPTSAEDDDYGRAERLAFMLRDSLPDRELLEIAASGCLRTHDEVAVVARDRLGDPRVHAKTRGFLHRWLDIEHVADLTKDAARFPSFDAAVASDLRTSLDLFLDDVVWGENPDFRRVLLANELWVNDRLAEFYGFDPPSDAAFRRVDADPRERAGIVSHPYLLARFAYTDASSPIHRGVFLLRGVLGRPLLPPPEAFAPLPATLHPELTTRERVALQTRPPACKGCHDRINPLGFALENYDAVGRFRDSEDGRPIDSHVELELASGETSAIRGARELAEFLAATEDTHRALSTQIFHHFVQQPVFAYGPRTPETLCAAFRAANFDLRELIVEAVTTAVLGPPAPDAVAAPGVAVPVDGEAADDPDTARVPDSGGAHPARAPPAHARRRL